MPYLEDLPEARRLWIEREYEKALKVETVLRDYQVLAVIGCRDAVMHGENPVIRAATGSGKTHMGVSILNGAAGRGNPVLWLAHRRELTTQASERLDAFGVTHGRIEAGFEIDLDSGVQVASVQTLVRRVSIPAVAEYCSGVKVVIVDEAHYVRAATHSKILAACPSAVVIGLTATPVRLDGRGLGANFDRIVEPITAEELIDGGFLAEPEYFSNEQPDFSGVRVLGGEYDQSQSSAIMGDSQIVGGIVKNIVENCRNRRGVIFASSIVNSIDLVERLNDAGIVAAHVDGETPKKERDEILADVRSGEVQFVSNVNILTEGWDLPALEVCVDASPSASWSRVMQRWGRIMRPADGKARPTVYDHAGNLPRHGFPTDRVEISLDDAPTRKAPAPKAKVCRFCHAAAPIAAKTCPSCGMAFPIRERTGPEVVEGDLKNVKTTRPSAATKAAFYEALLVTCSALGYKRGYATHRYRDEFGVMPRGTWFRPLVSRFEKACPHTTVEFGACRFCLRPEGEFGSPDVAL